MANFAFFSLPVVGLLISLVTAGQGQYGAQDYERVSKLEARSLSLLTSNNLWSEQSRNVPVAVQRPGYSTYYGPSVQRQLTYTVTPPPTPVSAPAYSPAAPVNQELVHLSFNNNNQQSDYGNEQSSSYPSHIVQNPHPVIPITHFQQDIQEGNFNRFHLSSANGIEQEEETLIKNGNGGSVYNNNNNNYNNYGQEQEQNYGSSSDNYNGNYDNNYDNAEIVKRGRYSYYSPEGQKIEVQWIADKDGFRPVGSHIPTPAPPVSSYVAPNSFPARQFYYH